MTDPLRRYGRAGPGTPGEGASSARRMCVTHQMIGNAGPGAEGPQILTNR